MLQINNLPPYLQPYLQPDKRMNTNILSQKVADVADKQQKKHYGGELKQDLITPDGWSSLVLLSKTTPWDEGKIGDLFPLSIHGE